MNLKIIDVKKFVTGIIIILSLCIFVGIIFTNKSYSKTEETYKTEIIISGDTIWEIAKNEKNTNEYYKGKDIRYIVYDIKNINSISDNTLSEGQKILIPTYK